MNNKAFSFPEIIVATVIMAILAAGMLGAFVGAQYFLNRTRHRMQAFEFAREVCDKLRSNYGYNDTGLVIGDHEASEIGVSIIGDLQPLWTDFTYSISEESDAYKEVTVVVKWDEDEGL